jgi:hypothetical protein
MLTVPSNVPWTYTGIHVRAGDHLFFDSAGEIRLSFGRDDIAHPRGFDTRGASARSPVPSAPAGSLVGRVNSGTPFPIGSAPQPVRMPASGILFLGVNDDHTADNSGNYVVTVR